VPAESKPPIMFSIKPFECAFNPRTKDMCS
jgi:hypothetical protein